MASQPRLDTRPLDQLRIQDPWWVGEDLDLPVESIDAECPGGRGLRDRHHPQEGIYPTQGEAAGIRLQTRGVGSVLGLGTEALKK